MSLNVVVNSSSPSLHWHSLIRQRPCDIHSILVSDLHLALPELAPQTADSCNLATGSLGQAFLALLDDILALPDSLNIRHLYILGDWFDAWLGDDVADTPAMQIWLNIMLGKLQQLTNKNWQIFVMVGNRDFLLGQKFCNKFGGKLLKAPHYLRVADKTIRLEHGDALCTDDKKYQWFRRIIQNPVSKTLLLAQPLPKRLQIAQNLRQKSRQDNAQKSMQIMDVNPNAVLQAVKKADYLIHGHTHRPAIHPIGAQKMRLVLGDWRINPPNPVSQTNFSDIVAMIGVILQDAKNENFVQLALVEFNYLAE